MTSTLKIISRRVALTLAVSACFSPVTQAAELLTEGVFKVGMEVTYPPFESYDSNNNIVGLDPEFAALIAQHLQAKPQLIDTKFTSLILGIGKKYDAVISGMYVTPERQKQADAIPYALSGASIIALKGGAVQPKTEDELCGVKVGLQAGTTWVTSLKKHSDEWCLKNGKPAITIQEFPTAPEASQALLSKNIGAQLEIAPAAGWHFRLSQSSRKCARCLYCRTWQYGAFTRYWYGLGQKDQARARACGGGDRRWRFYRRHGV